MNNSSYYSITPVLSLSPCTNMQTLTLLPPTSCKIKSSISTKEIKENRPVAENGKHEVKFMNIKKMLGPSLMAAALLTLSPVISPPVSFGQTIEVHKGASLFNRACIACHVGGGNIIQPGATLFLKDLQRNGVDTEDEIYRVTYYGKGRMPGFGVDCKPRGQCTFGARLQEDEIRLLAEFVKSQAAEGWLNIEISGD